jgi:hypothetical protein
MSECISEMNMIVTEWANRIRSDREVKRVSVQR